MTALQGGNKSQATEPTAWRYRHQDFFAWHVEGREHTPTPKLHKQGFPFSATPAVWNRTNQLVSCTSANNSEATATPGPHRFPCDVVKNVRAVEAGRQSNPPDVPL